jgi:hypothetical protein
MSLFLLLPTSNFVMWDVYQLLNAAVTNTTAATPPEVQFRWETDGTIDQNEDDGGGWSTSGQWITPTSGDKTGARLRFTQTSADVGGSWATGAAKIDGTTWHNLETTTQTIGWVTGGGGPDIGVLQVELSMDGGSSVAATGSYTFTSGDTS